MQHSSVSPRAGAALVDTTKNLRDKLQQVISALDSLPSDSPPPVRERSSRVAARDVHAVIRARRERTQFFRADLFADPAWDILLELYLADLAQRRVSISSLCIGAAVPATTALRWINTLEKEGLLRRNNDPFDGRRVYASLSETGLNKMDAYFAATSVSSSGII